MRAKLFLKDDYHEIADFIKKLEDGDCLLDVEENNLEPVNRIVRSMPSEVVVVEKNYVQYNI